MTTFNDAQTKSNLAAMYTSAWLLGLIDYVFLSLLTKPFTPLPSQKKQPAQHPQYGRNSVAAKILK
ncbi:MAG: hypothetical protein GY880_28915 [Planctomycetaceae bacterium]|nr:hypothetical protein [Planctomycetaceae bacterium]MCP4479505.1 hypothetical protein [Planctomycetaceae bacterium]MCP4778256.1 hypothetical protein [Planctomycetaceae bacterium]